MSAVSENIQTEIPGPLVFADSAAAKVADLIIEESNHQLKLRVFFQAAVAQAFPRALGLTKSPTQTTPQ
jgi:Fe-S cluster assembly iron-binding protein IscA